MESESTNKAADGTWRNTAAWIVVLGTLVRLLLVAFGRETVLDGFYLHAAWRIARGDAPYVDFTHVAYPTLEYLYALAFRLGFPPWATASLLTGVAVIATACLLGALLHQRYGRAVALTAALAYQCAAPMVAWHGFEREIWTNLGLAAALFLVVRRSVVSDKDAAFCGLLLALTISFKLTAIIGVLVIATEIVRRGSLRALAIAGAMTLLPLVALGLLLFARYGAEFAVQVFAFYFFKGTAVSFAEKLRDFARYCDPALAIGVLGLALGPQCPRLRMLRWLAIAWIGYYLFASPSFWDHNTIDILLPCAAGVGIFLIHAFRARSKVRFAVALVLSFLCIHAFEDEDMRWNAYPYGLGNDVTADLANTARILGSLTHPDEFVVVPNPLHGVIANRVPFVGDFELEAVARGLLIEIRRGGLFKALARRDRGALLGEPEGTPQFALSQNLFQDRIAGNVLVHLMPRILDAVKNRELGALISPLLPPDAMKVLASSGYVAIDDPDVKGFRRN